MSDNLDACDQFILPDACVTENGFVVEKVFENGVELSSNARKVYKGLKGALKYLIVVYIVPFQGLLEAFGQSGHDFFESVQAVNRDAPYSSHWTALL